MRPQCAPQYLFYSRIMADILGRLLPRRRALMVTSPRLLLGGALSLVAVGAAFFVYLQVPSAWLCDPFAMLLVVILWAVGGYIK